MSKELWTAVDRYIADSLVPSDTVLESCLASMAAAKLPAIQVSPAQGKLLFLLAQIAGAAKILELGTLGGYSTLWLARALPPGGRLITLEADAKHAQVAAANFARAGFEDRIELRLGRAIDTLPRLAEDGSGPFDLIFIDADKPSIPQYLDWALKLSHPGSVLIIDNVIRDGALADAANRDPNVQGVRRLHELLAKEPRVVATTIQTVGSKGYDGFTLARVVQ
jgi:predicted O-methyltransferase YrrM